MVVIWLKVVINVYYTQELKTAAKGRGNLLQLHTKMLINDHYQEKNIAQSATMATILLHTMMNVVSASTETSVIATKAKYTSRTQLEANTLNYGDSNVLEISTNSPRETTYYYMHDEYYCGFWSHYRSYTNFSSSEDDAYVEAWTDSSNRHNTYTSCNYTFGSFVADNLKFRFESLKIHDCEVEIKIYLRPNNHGIPDVCMNLQQS